MSRERHNDVSNSIDVTDPIAVSDAIVAILVARYPLADFSSIPVLVADFARLYRGEYPG